MLTVESLEAGYGQTSCLKGISLEVREKEIVALLGANGAGKTTTLMTISGLVSVHAGTIAFHGASLVGAAPERVVRLGISHVPEGRRILPRLTVMENLELGAYLQQDRAALAQDLQRVFALFPVLAERRRQLAGTLSGGEQQMLAMGRGLMARPKLLLLDEPSLGLAPKLVVTIFQTIQRINQEGVTILLVEQNAYLALQIAHRGYVLETGRIVLTDTAAALAQNPQVKAAYLGG
ncbi:MAG: ABC transporter ATP-binding protein [Candidatus Omnitrophica bacterium]|nr:ABC transporter ATP-binding protein [Candidatus Omnitrophota bacterium]